MKYAVLESGGKQHLVSEGEKIAVDKLNEEDGKKYQFSKVLMIRDEEKIVIGTPYIKNALVEGKIINQTKGEKIKVSKFRAKVRYRRTIGFRPLYTNILIDNYYISFISITKINFISGYI